MPRAYLLTPALLLLIALCGVRFSPDVAQAGVNLPPVVTIISPTNGAVFAPGEPILFSGTAIDPETGPLGGVQMIWNSNIQPGLGTGTSFTRTNLREGTHVVTLRGSAPGGGGQATQAVTIIVGNPTATPTSTDTPVPPTATNTPTPVPPTATNTNTPVPPTATNTNTPVPPTVTRTSTAVPPTETRTPTVVPATATRTATRTSTPTAVPPTNGRRCADVNGDGRVRWDDVERIFRQIRRPYDARYDINMNGRVTFRDVELAFWQLGRRCRQEGTPTPTRTTAPPTATKTPAPPTATKTAAPATATKTPAPPTATKTPSEPTPTNTPILED